MRKIITGLAAAAIMATGVVATAPAASATHDCVSKSEFRRISRGDTTQTVHRIFDVRGQVSYQGYGYMDREYRPCTDRRYGFVNVGFERRNGAWVMRSKSAYWG